MTAAVLAVANPISGLQHMVGHAFIRHGLIAGTAIAATAGVIGYFLVLRSQVFTADALSHVAFTGGLVALTIGLDARAGLFVATIGVALLLGTIGPRGRADDVTIGSTFAWILGVGVLALSIFTTGHSTGHGTAGVNILFGSIYGLDASATRAAALVAAAVLALALLISRPLLFASLDEAVAAARGVPVRILGFVFLTLVGATAAEATQAVGALLILGLLAGPAGIAMRVTSRPHRAMALSTAIAVGAVWGGLGLSYAAPKLPPSFSILTLITIAYLGTVGVGASIRRGQRLGAAVDPRP
ncbi:MAG: ABC-type transporter, integral rane subunit [Acidimicrobiales bacterium]|jgi:zinc/manganese transport system permease protein|nr:ABC-type transporter, integral rane subunit [Acidimicrobiales bacterium]